MARLIDADALILALETQDYSGAPETLEGWTPQDLTKAEITDINNAPTIDAEPVRHGKWIEDDIDKWRCSVCQKGDVYAFSWSISEGYELQDNYCPSCGAKMKGEEE